MINTETAKLRADILKGMKISAEKLKALKKQLGQPVVISENGVIKEIPAQSLK
ncbi:hypothetical protein [Adhaeribacter soli]|uniref:hypothetical protein n=1 Tax=Adhaeribacter soli TaxID=2607655 RepID=UPI00177F879D|nr:hypothetical protein [Adhaeribacter soli]